MSGILAFYNPGIFQFTAAAGSAAAGSSSATAITTNQSGAYSNNIVTEGFVAKVAKAVKPSNPVIYKEPLATPLSSLYTAPLEAAPIKAPMFQELETNQRIKAIAAPATTACRRARSRPDDPMGAPCLSSGGPARSGLAPARKTDVAP